MQIVKLPYKIPPIVCYQFHAFPLGVLALYDECMPWVYNNYISIKCGKDWRESKSLWIDFISRNISGGISCLDYYIADKTFLGKGKSIFCEYLIDSINNKFYIYTFVDLYYIPHTNAYKKSHVIHDILILGYNLTEENFIVEHFNNEGKLAEFDVSSLELYNAFVNSIGNQNYIYNLITLFKRNQTKYVFDLDKVKSGLYNYLNAIDLLNYDNLSFSDDENMQYYNSEVYKKLKNHTSGWEKMRYKNLITWGIDVYNEIIGFYSDLLDNRVYFDLRPLHLLWEHKKVMLLRISYMENLKNIQGLSKILLDYSEIEKESLIIRNKLIKYQISKNPNIISNVGEQLIELVEKEKEILFSLYNTI